MKALEEHGNYLNISLKKSLWCPQKKEIFEEFANRRMEEIQDLSKQIAFNN